ncbi:MAG: thiamine pyrophosphate-dependent enzyme, partial [Sphingomonadales bacterium]
TKALLQSGVAYVGGYQGAPISHLMDVMADAHEVLDELGVHFEACANEAGAAAMLGASVQYPIRGAVTWKSTVGTNVASDALSNLASSGVTGGALIILGEDYGEGSSIIQERSHAFAMKSQIWLLDPRPNLPSIVDAVEQGFELSEASNTPVMLELRIRACHVYGRFDTRDNKPPAISTRNALEQPLHDYSKFALPPATYVQERSKIEERWPAAVKFIQERGLNELFPGEADDVGIILQGGMYNAVIRALGRLGLADAFGESRIPLYVLNVTYPLVPPELTAFCAGKKAVLIVEEGQPDFIEQAIESILRKADIQTTVVGKAVLPMAGEYTGEVMLDGVAKFIEGSVPKGVDLADVGARHKAAMPPRARISELLGGMLPARPPGFCVGCPERPVFSAMKIVQREIGTVHVSADIGCHTFAAQAPFNMGSTVLGYGLGLASSSAVAPLSRQRVISVMGDGGFWHNGLTSGVGNAMFNKDDAVLMLLDNGYAAATGGQYIPSTGKNALGQRVSMSLQQALRGLDVKWLRTVRTYDMAGMIATLRAAMTTRTRGLKVIVAEGECQLNRQRRIKPLIKKQMKEGKRIVQSRFGVDDTVCTGDHSCVRLSGCPSLTIKPNPDPLRKDPVAFVDNSCVGCGVCGEVAHAATLCPSFYRADIIHNPTMWDRIVDGTRRRMIGFLQGLDDRQRARVSL